MSLHPMPKPKPRKPPQAAEAGPLAQPEPGRASGKCSAEAAGGT
jgi:hypothetical protein